VLVSAKVDYVDLSGTDTVEWRAEAVYLEKNGPKRLVSMLDPSPVRRKRDGMGKEKNVVSRTRLGSERTSFLPDGRIRPSQTERSDPPLEDYCVRSILLCRRSTQTTVTVDAAHSPESLTMEAPQYLLLWIRGVFEFSSFQIFEPIMSGFSRSTRDDNKVSLFLCGCGGYIRQGPHLLRT
jgi:hypothetical protein